MDFLSQITPIVITWNEEPNIGRALGRLDWAREVLVVDSGSTDGTLEIAASHPKVRLLPRRFTGFSDQWNHALRHAQADWVMTLDADYLLSDALIEELRGLRPTADVAGYSCRFRYWVLGTPLRGSLYPPRTVLFRRTHGAFHDEGHQQRLDLTGRCELLANTIYHDDRKPLSRWLSVQERYASVEAQRLLAAHLTDLDWMDRIRRTGVWAAPIAVVYCLVVKRCLLDGRPGLYYVFQRGIAEAILALKLLENRTMLRSRHHT
jgi:glycosyltransferase involved in cell wall biosynthesis